MFKTLVANLSLSPSVSGQLAFYARRLRAEQLTRQLSAIFAGLLVVLTIVSSVAPPTPANATSSNDIVYGGVHNLPQLMNIYDNGNGGPGQSAADIQALYNFFGISRADLAQAKASRINSRDGVYSIGRHRHLASDKQLSIAGRTYYYRSLASWDTGSRVRTGSTYSAFVGTRSRDGGFFAVIMDCGNIVVKSIPTPSPTPSLTPTPTPNPVSSVACLGLTADKPFATIPATITFTGRGTSVNQNITEYDFDFGDGSEQTSATPTAIHSYAAEGRYTATLRIKGSRGTTTDHSAACSYTVTTAVLPPNIEIGKAAANTTQGVDATTVPANAGDVIIYTLTTKNTGDGVSKAYVISEQIEDILEYADVTDNGGADFREGTLTWPAEDIPAHATVTKKFTVTVKSPIPETPVSSSDPQSFDLCMDNVYGNLVRICVTPPPIKQIEDSTQSLPETGAGTSIMITLGFAGLVIYFYLRNRQLMAEIKILRHDYHGGIHS